MTVRLVNEAGAEIARTTDGRILFTSGLGLVADTTYYIHVKTDLVPTVYELEFITGPASNVAQSNAILLSDTTTPDIESLQDFASIVGRPLRNGNDQAWYRFRLPADTSLLDQVLFTALEADGPIELALIDSLPDAPQANVLRATSTLAGNQAGVLSIAGLKADTDYWFRVTGSGTARYEIAPNSAAT